MTAAFEEQFHELDWLLRKCEHDINLRERTVCQILTDAYQMQRKGDDDGLNFIPASAKEWKAFYKCPRRFKRKFNVYPCQVYFPKRSPVAAITHKVSIKDAIADRTSFANLKVNIGVIVKCLGLFFEKVLAANSTLGPKAVLLLALYHSKKTPDTVFQEMFQIFDIGSKLYRKSSLLVSEICFDCGFQIVDFNDSDRAPNTGMVARSRKSHPVMHKNFYRLNDVVLKPVAALFKNHTNPQTFGFATFNIQSIVKFIFIVKCCIEVLFSPTGSIVRVTPVTQRTLPVLGSSMCFASLSPTPNEWVMFQFLSKQSDLQKAKNLFSTQVINKITIQ